MADNKKRIRTLERRFLKPDCVEVYCEYHRAVWPELEQLYKEHGVSTISCFLHDCELLVLYEYDPDIFEPKLDELKKHPVETKWQRTMRQFADEDRPVTAFEEVYRL